MGAPLRPPRPYPPPPGKSTLLKIIAGQDSHNNGVVTRNKGARVGYLPQVSPCNGRMAACMRPHAGRRRAEHAPMRGAGMGCRMRSACVRRCVASQQLAWRAHGSAVLQPHAAHPDRASTAHSKPDPRHLHPAKADMLLSEDGDDWYSAAARSGKKASTSSGGGGAAGMTVLEAVLNSENDAARAVKVRRALVLGGHKPGSRAAAAAAQGLRPSQKAALLLAARFRAHKDLPPPRPHLTAPPGSRQDYERALAAAGDKVTAELQSAIERMDALQAWEVDSEVRPGQRLSRSQPGQARAAGGSARPQERRGAVHACMRGPARTASAAAGACARGLRNWPASAPRPRAWRACSHRMHTRRQHPPPGTPPPARRGGCSRLLGSGTPTRPPPA